MLSLLRAPGWRSEIRGFFWSLHGQDYGQIWVCERVLAASTFAFTHQELASLPSAPTRVTVTGWHWSTQRTRAGFR